MSQEEFDDFVKDKDLMDQNILAEVCSAIKERFPDKTDKELLKYMGNFFDRKKEVFDTFTKDLSKDLDDEEIKDVILEKFPDWNRSFLNRKISSYLQDRTFTSMMEWAEKAQREQDKANARRQVLPVVDSIMECREEMKPFFEYLADIFIERWMARQGKKI